ncbi:hypothetical protein HYU16_00095 [Candidatus Woesearchaeota archaeon]|nr:hypothetical protein [Candidatus Woesearchaeota archaeon]
MAKPKWFIGFKLLIIATLVGLFTVALFLFPIFGIFTKFLPFVFILVLVIFIEPIYDFIHGKGAFRQWLKMHK